jgi:selenocysteine-specific elongation factor
LIIATAGHVDHGKTSLVRQLTGVDTDRLDEEKRRGLSISLGYAYWRPDDDTTIGFIDVPGHRRFINNMISGISGIDVGLLVVAADDGPMPQTREHVDVMNLLGVERYVLVVSKCDRVDDTRVQTVCDAASALLPAGTPIYRISNTTAAGIAELRAALANLARASMDRKAGGHLRMSIDRAFHLQGRGLVMTGTIASGSVATGDTVILQPHRKPLRVRSIHTQDAPASSGQAGERCALNVTGDVHKDEIERGDWLSGEGCIDTTHRFDVRLQLLPDAAFPLKHLSTVKLHIGAKHLEARLVLLQNDVSRGSRINPGESMYAQLVTDRPILCCHGDRFLIRDYGETATLGGGMVLDPHGAEKRRSSAARLSFLAAMETDDIEEAIRAALEDEHAILDYDNLLRAWNLDPRQKPGRLLRDIARVDTADGPLWLAKSRWADILQSITDALGDFHRQHAAQPGIEQGLLSRTALRPADRRLFSPAIAELESSGAVRLVNGLVAASGFTVARAGQDDPGWMAVATCLEQHGVQIPGLTQLRSETRLPGPALNALLEAARRDGRLVRVNSDRYAGPETINVFARAILTLTEGGQPLTVAACRDYLGCGRNVLIDVLEYFDSIGFTRRTGNARIVLDRDFLTSAAMHRITTRKSDVPGGAPGLQNQ